MKIRILFLIRVFSVFVFLLSRAWAGDFMVFTTDSLVEDLGKLPPEVAFFFNPAGPLNRFNGVVGSAGTLGKFSPYGPYPWSATTAMRSVGNWEALQESLTKLGGPLSENGPYLLMTEAGQGVFDLYSTSFPGTPLTNLFASLRSGSPLHVLGDAGPLGALSIMGPGGPNGATGFEQRANGEFINGRGEVVHSLDVETRDGLFEAPLYELYSEDKQLKSPDSFFAMDSKLTRRESEKTISFTNKRNQVISILLISDYTLDDMELTLKAKGSDKVIATTNNQILSNFIIFEAPRGTEFEVTIKLKNSYHMLPKKGFRLFVTGSSERATQFKGPHQRSYKKSLLRFNKSITKNLLSDENCGQLMRALL